MIKMVSAENLEFLPWCYKYISAKHWAIAAPGLWLSKIRWLSNYRIYEEQDMYDSLEAAFKAHEVATGRPVSPERLQPAPAHP
jgi:hypothetical protein